LRAGVHRGHLSRIAYLVVDWLQIQDPFWLAIAVGFAWERPTGLARSPEA